MGYCAACGPWGGRGGGGLVNKNTSAAQNSIAIKIHNIVSMRRNNLQNFTFHVLLTLQCNLYTQQPQLGSDNYPDHTVSPCCF